MDVVDDEYAGWVERAAAEADDRNRRHVGQSRIGNRWYIGRSVPMGDGPADDGAAPGPPEPAAEPWTRSTPADMDTLRRLHAGRQRRENGDKP